MPQSVWAAVSPEAQPTAQDSSARSLPISNHPKRGSESSGSNSIPLVPDTAGQRAAVHASETRSLCEVRSWIAIAPLVSTTEQRRCLSPV